MTHHSLPANMKNENIKNIIRTVLIRTTLMSFLLFASSANAFHELGLTKHDIAKLLQTNKPIKSPTHSKLRVIATAYTSHAAQTDSTPDIAAWGDRLKPGMKAIAVSRDLLNHYGLSRGSMVRINGLPGEYKVLDKMNKRWEKRIDISMGKNRRKAFRWGKRPVIIEWKP